jgi:hypothetical protein
MTHRLGTRCPGRCHYPRSSKVSKPLREVPGVTFGVFADAQGHVVGVAASSADTVATAREAAPAGFLVAAVTMRS